MSNIYRSMYFRILYSLFFINMCQCAILRIGTLTGCLLFRKRHSLCRLKNTTIIYMITCELPYGKQVCVFNRQLLVVLERETESVAVQVKIRKTQRVWCIMCSSFAFLQGNFIYTNWYTTLNHFASDVCVDPILQNSLREPIIFKISIFSPNNRRKNKSW